VTQAPTDVPSSVLAQLGNRVQHALRAFTPEDADALRKTARTFPMTDFYDVERIITSLGIGEALVTVLSPKGVPTELAATRLVPPDSMMAAIDDAALRATIAGSLIATKYATRVDPMSAHEIITGRIQAAKAAADAAAAAAGVPGAAPGGYPGATYPGALTPAQQAREIARAQREAAAEARREQREADAERRRQQREAAAEERQRRRMMETGVRTAGRVLSSRTGQTILRGVFGTLFGGGRR
jgi:hypothetical protein